MPSPSPMPSPDEPRPDAAPAEADLAQLRRAERALLESEERYRTIVGSVTDLVIQVDQQGVITYINRTIAPNTPDRIIGTRATEWTSAAHRPIVQQAIDDVFRTGEIRDYQAEGIGERGAVVWYAVRVSPVVVEGQVRSAILVARDVTERQRIELALRESEAQYRLLAEHSSDLITRHALNGDWVYVSPACQAILGEPCERLIGKSPFERLHPDDHEAARAVFASMIETHQPQWLLCRMRRADGSYVWLETSGQMVLDPSTQRPAEIVAISRDVTARMETFDKLRRRDAELAHADRLNTMGYMASELAHELNQPLYAIANFADACLGLVDRALAAGSAATEGPSAVELRRWLEQIAQQARRAGNVLKRISQFARKGEFHRKPLDLNQCIRDVASMLEFELRRHEVELKLELAPRMPVIEGDQLLLEQVLVNLIRNAQQAMEEKPRGERKLTIRSFAPEGGRVGAAVCDTGTGLRPDELQNVFVPYFTTKVGGTGMGLAICRATIEAHGGEIWAYNNPQGGATFQFVLPVAKRPTVASRD